MKKSLPLTDGPKSCEMSGRLIHLPSIPKAGPTVPGVCSFRVNPEWLRVLGRLGATYSQPLVTLYVEYDPDSCTIQLFTISE